MRTLLLALLLSGCSYTTITTPVFKMRTQANIKNATVNADGSFHFDEMNHSVPTLAGGKAIGGAATAIGSAAMGVAASSIFKLK